MTSTESRCQDKDDGYRVIMLLNKYLNNNSLLPTDTPRNEEEYETL